MHMDDLEVKGTRPGMRSRKTWLEVVKNDMIGFGLNKCRCSGPSYLEEEDCGRYMLTQVCFHGILFRKRRP